MGFFIANPAWRAMHRLWKEEVAGPAVAAGGWWVGSRTTWCWLAQMEAPARLCALMRLSSSLRRVESAVAAIHVTVFP